MLKKTLCILVSALVLELGASPFLVNEEAYAWSIFEDKKALRREKYSFIRIYDRKDTFVRNEEGQLEIPKQSNEFGVVDQGAHYRPISSSLLIDKRVQEAIRQYFLVGIQEYYTSVYGKLPGKEEQMKARIDEISDFINSFLFTELNDAGRLGDNFLHVWINKDGEGVVNLNNRVWVLPQSYASITALLYYERGLTDVIQSASQNVSDFRRIANTVKSAYSEYKDVVKLLTAGAVISKIKN